MSGIEVFDEQDRLDNPEKQESSKESQSNEVVAKKNYEVAKESVQQLDGNMNNLLGKIDVDTGYDDLNKISEGLMKISGDSRKVLGSIEGNNNKPRLEPEIMELNKKIEVGVQISDFLQNAQIGKLTKEEKIAGIKGIINDRGFPEYMKQLGGGFNKNEKKEVLAQENPNQPTNSQSQKNDNISNITKELPGISEIASVVIDAEKQKGDINAKTVSESNNRQFA